MGGIKGAGDPCWHGDSCRQITQSLEQAIITAFDGRLALFDACIRLRHKNYRARFTFSNLQADQKKLNAYRQYDKRDALVIKFTLQGEDDIVVQQRSQHGIFGEDDLTAEEDALGKPFGDGR
jgi:hypothetical protein